MAPYESGNTSTGGPGEREGADVTDLRAGRRRAARYVVPVAVVGIAAATIGLVPALADSGDPKLPKITAQELIEKIAKSDVQQVSGTVKVSTDLGLPNLGGLAGGFTPPGGKGGDHGSSADPQAKLMELASGTHTLRVAADGPDKQKLSILDDSAEYSIIHNGADMWAYDSASNEAYHAKDPASGERAHKESPKGLPKDVPATPKEFADEVLKAADDTTSVTVDGTAHVAGRDAYKLLVKPKQSGTTVGAITVAVDAKTGTPLKFTLTPSSGGAAVVDAGFTTVDFGKPAASTFRFTPPKGTKVTEADGPGARGKGHEHGDFGKFHDPASGKVPGKGAGDGEHGDTKVIGKGWNSIAVLEAPGGKGLPSAKSGDTPPEAQKFMDALGAQVHGKFGSGTVFSTRLINALVTDDGKVYVGAVTKDALVKAANAAK
ncbi:LolA family protein [Streptomyces sp. NPDC002004]